MLYAGHVEAHQAEMAFLCVHHFAPAGSFASMAMMALALLGDHYSGNISVEAL